MERCSFFVQDKALFGSYPTQETVDLLEKLGVRHFVNLTVGNERFTSPYKTRHNYIHYPIPDHSIPYDWKTFAQLVLDLCDLIKNSEDLVYIHCKGGIGRSSLVVSVILAHLYNLSPDLAMTQAKIHQMSRKELKEKYRRSGTPYQPRQRDFVHKFFRPLRYCNKDLNFNNSFSHYLNNYTNYPISIPGLGTFPNAHFAFLSYKDPENIQYVEKLKNGHYDKSLITNFDKLLWKYNRIQYMSQVLEYKFLQHPNLRHILMNTGLRPLIKLSKNSFWGIGLDGKGKNIHGRLLTNLRNSFLKSDRGVF